MWVDDTIHATGGDWRFAVRANRIAIGLTSYELCKKLVCFSLQRKGGQCLCNTQSALQSFLIV